MWKVRKAWLHLPALLVVTALVVPQTAEARKRRKRPMGTVTIESMTEGAKVYIDGKSVGKTPFDKPIKVRPGKHKLKATKFGYSTLEQEFKIRARRKLTLEVDLIPHSGLVKFDCNQAGAEVYVDGKLLGNSPLIKTIPIGDHKVMIIKEGFNDFSADVNVKAGEKHFIEGVLTPFQDFSPEVLAIRKAQEEEAERQKLLAAQIEREQAAQDAAESDPAVAWYSGLHEKWWFWTAVGVVVVTAVAVPVAVTSGGSQSGLNDHTSPIDPIEIP